jgi:hypothetical protein
MCVGGLLKSLSKHGEKLGNGKSDTCNGLHVTGNGTWVNVTDSTVQLKKGTVYMDTTRSI